MILTGSVQVVDILVRFASKISGNLFKSPSKKRRRFLQHIVAALVVLEKGLDPYRIGTPCGYFFHKLKKIARKVFKSPLSQSEQI